MSVLASGAPGSVAPLCTAGVDNRVHGAGYNAADSTLDHRSAVAIAAGSRPADYGAG
jgi:hypothetical protein